MSEDHAGDVRVILEMLDLVCPGSIQKLELF